MIKRKYLESNSVSVHIKRPCYDYVFYLVCIHEKSKNNGSIYLKLEHIVVYENSSDEHWVLSDQGHSVTLKFFSICHNTNCEVLYLSFDMF